MRYLPGRKRDELTKAIGTEQEQNISHKYKPKFKKILKTACVTLISVKEQLLASSSDLRG